MKQFQKYDKLIFFLVLFSLVTLVGCKRDKQGSKKPNIILIMSDDMGFSDIGCYGGVINTPTLDGLAENGLRFTQFYNTARCCPTRASLLTGLYPHQAGIGHMLEDRGAAGYRGDLSNNVVTIAEVLKQAGYSTYISGKWHVTPYSSSVENPSKHNWPLKRGFDKFFGTIHGAGSYFDPSSLARDNDFIIPKENFYYTDAISDNAVKFIEGHNSDKPFFIYLPYTAAHWPMHAKPEDIEKYKGKFDDGWDVLRRTKYMRMLEMGLINSETKLSEKDNIPDWQDVELKGWYSSLMEVYAAMVDCMDQGIGRVMRTLENKGIQQNTLVFFLQDNGGSAEQFGLRQNTIGPYQRPQWMGGQDEVVDVDAIKPMKKNELQTEMVPKYTRDGRPVMGGKGLKPGTDNTYLAYDKPWANASNTPFRTYKHWVHEGGISSPLIVHWPEGIKAKNELRHQPSHLIDIMATCVDVAGAIYPKSFNNHKVIPLEGISLTPVFKNKELQSRPIFWEHEGNKAVRLGKYKLVSIYKVGSEYNWELYDLERDRSETINMIGEMPGKAQELEILWKNWAKKAGVLTWGESQHIE